MFDSKSNEPSIQTRQNLPMQHAWELTATAGGSILPAAPPAPALGPLEPLQSEESMHGPASVMAHWSDPEPKECLADSVAPSQSAERTPPADLLPSNDGPSGSPGRGANWVATSLETRDPSFILQQDACNMNQPWVALGAMTVQAKSVDLVQRVNPEQVHDLASRGIQGQGQTLPYLNLISRSFGRHNVCDVKAYIGEPASHAAAAIGAKAYAANGAVVFGSPPDLHTAAHEAAHVVQQRHGVQLSSGVGQAGDAHEAHADRVADCVVRGVSAESLLDLYAGGSTTTGARSSMDGFTSSEGMSAHSALRAGSLQLKQNPTASLDAIPPGGVTVNQIGIVHQHDEPLLRLRSTPDTKDLGNLICTLPFNTHVQVIKRFPGDWYFVSTPSGEMGYSTSMHIWTNLPEPNASLHLVASGNDGFAINIAQKYYGEYADDWGQDLRFYVNALAWANKKKVPDTANGWKSVNFEANNLIWIPSYQYAKGLVGVINSGSISYNIADRLGLASTLNRVEQLLKDFDKANAYAHKYLGGAIAKYAEKALIDSLISLAIAVVGGIAILAISTAIGAAIGALAGGVGAAPGAAAGFEVGMVILEWLGLGMLISWVACKLVVVGGAFADFIGTVWRAHGDDKILELAGQKFADALGRFIGALIEGAVMLAASYGVGKAANLLRTTRLGRAIGESRLGSWLAERVANFKQGNAKLPRPRDVLTRFYRNVEITDPKGNPVGEFDGVDLTQRQFIEDKSASGLDTINPKTGQPQQTPIEWATRQIVDKTNARIRNLSTSASQTRATVGGSANVPSLAEIRGIRSIHFRINADTPALRAAVSTALMTLRGSYPGWTFTADFGSNILLPPIPIDQEGDQLCQ